MTPPKPDRVKTPMKLCIDPGHGLSNRAPGVYDPGATACGDAEADIALAWALALKKYATDAGIECFMTRDSAEDAAPVAKRAQRAQFSGCTHFISLHCNAAANPLARGTETFYRDSADKALAAKVQKAAMSAIGSADRGLKDESASQHNRLAVFGFQGPCCLLEIGFITNPGDRKKMKERERRIAFALAMVTALLEAG